MSLKNVFNFQTGLKNGKPTIFWQEKLSVREREEPVAIVPKTKVRPKYLPPMAPKSQQIAQKDNKVVSTASNIGKRTDASNALKKQSKKNMSNEEKKIPANRGVVTMTQKQLDAILQTIGQLTTENAELQTKLTYNNETEMQQPAIKHALKKENQSSERATRDSGYYEESAAAKDNIRKGNGDNYINQSPRQVRISSPVIPTSNNVAAAQITRPAESQRPITKAQQGSEPPVGLPVGHLTKAEKLRMKLRETEDNAGDGHFPWTQSKVNSNTPAANMAAMEYRSKPNVDEGNFSGPPPKSNADLKREQWEKEREMLKHLEEESKAVERRAARPVGVVHQPASVESQSVQPPPPSQTAAHLSPKMMSKAELMKIKWEKERAEMQKHEPEVWDPFGRPGGGAPLKDKRGNLLTDYHSRKDDVEEMQKVFIQSHNFDNQPAAQHMTGAAPPAAIRSAFVIGGAAPDENRFAATKEQEKKRWLEELDKQRDEIRRRTIEGKMKDPDRSPDTVALYDKLTAPSQGYTTIDDMMKKSPEKVVQPSTFLRGQNVPIDDVKKMEIDEKKRKELEHQEYIRQQIEEKQRKKDEEKRLRQQEDLAEEMRMQKEREIMSLQLQLEKLKVKAKEEEQESKVDTLKRAIEAAHREAERSKQMLKHQKLQRNGHDVSGLQQTTENSHQKDWHHQQAASHQGAQAASVVHVQPMHIPGLQLTARDVASKLEPYTEDRILTPTKYQSPHRDKHSMREFGVQAELDEMNTSRRIALRDDSAGIMYNNGLVEMDEKENIVKRVIADNRNEPASRKGVLKKAKSNRSKSRRGVKQAWFYQNLDGKILPKASDRDVTLDDAVREQKMAMREQRKQYLLQQVEANANRIPTLSKAKSRSTENVEAMPTAVKQVKSSSNGQQNVNKTGGEMGKTRTITRQPGVVGKTKDDMHVTQVRKAEAVVSVPSKDTARLSAPTARDAEYYVDQHNYDNYARKKPAPADTKTAAANATSRKPVAEKYVDKIPTKDAQPESARNFVPFLRSVNVLDPAMANEPLPESREPSAMRRAREAYLQEQQPSKFGVPLENHDDRRTRHHMTDHIVNDAAVPSSLQQERILKQLADLKKGLLQKRFEVDRAPSDMK